MTQLLRSWVESANSTDTDFPLDNLPSAIPSCNCWTPQAQT